MHFPKPQVLETFGPRGFRDAQPEKQTSISPQFQAPPPEPDAHSKAVGGWVGAWVGSAGGQWNGSRLHSRSQTESVGTCWGRPFREDTNLANGSNPVPCSSYGVRTSAQASTASYDDVLGLAECFGTVGLASPRTRNILWSQVLAEFCSGSLPLIPPTSEKTLLAELWSFAGM